MELPHSIMLDRIQAIRESLRKKHYLRPVIRRTINSDSKNYYVEICSRHIKNGSLQKIHIDVDSEEHAERVIDLLSEAFKTGNDLCVVEPLYEDIDIRFAARPKKIESGYYEYRGYEIMDQYITDGIADGGSKIGRWLARKMTHLGNEYFGSFDRLLDAMYYIDLHLKKEESQP